MQSRAHPGLYTLDRAVTEINARPRKKIYTGDVKVALLKGITQSF